MNATMESKPKVVTREQWLGARRALLAEEKELTRRRDELARRRRELPWVKVDEKYLFDTPAGKRTLAELFEGRSQLVVYHFMLGPDWPEGCQSCSMAADGFDATALHLAQRDVTFAAVSRAPLPQIEAFRQRMGWRFNWASSHGNDFNRDYGVTFTKDELAGSAPYNYGTMRFPVEEAPGVSVFYKDDNGDVYHTYSAYARGLEPLLGVYFLLDMVPAGRDEAGLPFPMAWVRHHDRYEAGSRGNGAACGCEKHGRAS
jgi:predicted dithiol-disulfide oxidoreductase (DUF899 family)